MHNIPRQYHNVDITLPSTFLSLQIANTSLEYTPSDDDDENSYKSTLSNINENQQSYNNQETVNQLMSKMFGFVFVTQYPLRY